MCCSDEHQHFDISTPDAILRETGWNLPLHALHYWIKGIPAPGLDIQALEVNAGLLRHLDQSGWTITYQDYGQFGRHTLPTKLQIEASDTRIRLIIRRWTVEAV